jgi:hypothetical protein
MPILGPIWWRNLRGENSRFHGTDWQPCVVYKLLGLETRLLFRKWFVVALSELGDYKHSEHTTPNLVLGISLGTSGVQSNVSFNPIRDISSTFHVSHIQYEQSTANSFGPLHAWVLECGLVMKVKVVPSSASTPRITPKCRARPSLGRNLPLV